jgi:trimeric autotransporter adhesin
VKNFYLFLFLLILASPSPSLAGSSYSLTYQGRILKPDGSTPFEGSATFRFEIKTDVSACVLWREDVALNLAGTQGGMSMQIGLGANLASGAQSFIDVFDNTKTLTGLSGCAIGTSFTPQPNSILVTQQSGPSSG